MLARFTYGVGVMPRRKSTGAFGSDQSELVGVVFDLQPDQDFSLYPEYAIGLHAWFLNQVRQFDPRLSAQLHDGESEKPFTISRLEGIRENTKGAPQLQAGQTYRWFVSGLSQPVVQWMGEWLKSPPQILELRHIPLQVQSWEIAQPLATYAQLLQTPCPPSPKVTLTFVSPTAFRRKGHHLPLPLPANVFQSYLRRWNDFSGDPVDPEDFLAWVDESVVILRHQIQSMKVVGGKKGSVTGFVGQVEFGLTGAAAAEGDYKQLFVALGQLAPYCGTGHKTTFGLGQTRLGWLTTTPTLEPMALQSVLAQRIEELTDQFVAQRKRTGGERARNTAETWATILARRELGESLQTIAADLEMAYETVKTYAKLARRAIAVKD
jgi:CRISPR-associated endoribonuclease Cas6